MSTFAVLVISRLLLLMAVSAGEGDDAPPAKHSARELRAMLAQAQHRISDLYVVYRSEGARYGSDRFPSGTYLQRIVAVSKNDFLLHVNSHGHDGLHWKDDPLQQRCYVMSDRWYVFNPINRTYLEGALKPVDPLPGSMKDEHFFRSTGIWPFDSRPAPRVDDRPYMLREVATCEQFSFVRAHLEHVDGHWCHVLEWPECDTLWIDARRGCALLARETRSVPEGALMWRYEMGGHEQVAPGIWLPRWLRNIHFDYLARNESERERRVIDSTCGVLELKVNFDQHEELFEFTPPPGALDTTAETPRQAVPGGLDHLDDLVDWLDRNGPRGKEPFFVWSYLTYGMCGLTLLVVGFEAGRYWLRGQRCSR